LGNQTRKLLGAHQERILIAMKENTAVLILQTKLRTAYSISCVGKFNIIRFTSTALIHHLRRFTPIIRQLFFFFAPRNNKNLAPNKRTNFYSPNKEKMVDRLHVHQIQAKQ
jgi:hypothetical protein